MWWPYVMHSKAIMIEEFSLATLAWMLGNKEEIGSSHWLQVVPCQMHSFLHELSKNMTNDCKSNYLFIMRCLHQIVLNFKTQNLKQLLIELIYYQCKLAAQYCAVFWLNWRVNKYIWWAVFVYLIVLTPIVFSSKY